jgi:hypothetical protein
MKFSAKLTLALAAGSALFPVAVQALPSTGTTAAAVSIKFDGTSTGNFSIQPGSNAAGSGTGVRELSAAVATGETESTASSASLTSGANAGTTATAKGFSQPVTFSYVSTSDMSKVTSSAVVVNFNTFQNNASNVQASTTKNTSSENASNTTANDVKSASNNASDTRNASNNAGDTRNASNNQKNLPISSFVRAWYNRMSLLG